MGELSMEGYIPPPLIYATVGNRDAIRQSLVHHFLQEKAVQL